MVERELQNKVLKDIPFASENTDLNKVIVSNLKDNIVEIIGKEIVERGRPDVVSVSLILTENEKKEFLKSTFKELNDGHYSWEFGKSPYGEYEALIVSWTKEKQYGLSAAEEYQVQVGRGAVKLSDKEIVKDMIASGGYLEQGIKKAVMDFSKDVPKKSNEARVYVNKLFREVKREMETETKQVQGITR